MTVVAAYRQARHEEEVARLRRVLALRAMMASGMSQREIAAELGVSQPAVSQQLKVAQDLARIHPEALVEAAGPVLRSVAEDAGYRRLAVFGSVARGEARFDSDIDLVVEAPEGTSSFGFIRFKRLLEQVLGREIDLVDYGGLKPRLDDDIRRDASRDVLLSEGNGEAMNMNEPGVDLSIDGVVATVLLDRPDVRNAQHPGMWAAIAGFLESLPAEVRVVVVRGAGDTFSAGLDLSLVDPGQTEVAGGLVATLARSDQEVIDLIGEYQRPFAALADPRFISIAVVEGYAIGAGFQMALACDLRIMADDAWVCMKEPALGLVPDLAGTKPLVDAVGYSRALEICATARKVDAEEAGRIGLAQSVVPATELDSTLADLVGSLVAHDATAVRRTHELLAAASSRSLDEQRLAERTAQVGRLRAVLGR